MTFVDLLHNMSVNIRAARKNKGLTQAEAAELASMSLIHYEAIENGRDTPSLFALYKIANALNVSVEDLISVNSSSEANEVIAEFRSAVEKAIAEMERKLRKQDD